MKYLLDTNVVSELQRSFPDPAVPAWISAVSEQDLALSVISITEMRLGVGLLPPGKRQSAMEAWLNQTLRTRFAGRILPVTERVADQAGRLLAVSRKQGHSIDVDDVLIGATATEHGLTVVTRNVKHFAPMPVEVVNPWLASSSK